MTSDATDLACLRCPGGAQASQQCQRSIGMQLPRSGGTRCPRLAGQPGAGCWKGGGGQQVPDNCLLAWLRKPFLPCAAMSSPPPPRPGAPQTHSLDGMARDTPKGWGFFGNSPRTEVRGEVSMGHGPRGPALRCNEGLAGAWPKARPVVLLSMRGRHLLAGAHRGMPGAPWGAAGDHSAGPLAVPQPVVQCGPLVRHCGRRQARPELEVVPEPGGGDLGVLRRGGVASVRGWGHMCALLGSPCCAVCSRHAVCSRLQGALPPPGAPAAAR